MFYREAGQFKTTYQADQALFPIRQDQIGMVLILLAAYVLAPLTLSNFAIDSILIPVLIFSLAAIGLNLLTGYTGLLSLGTGGFMGVGAFACYKLATLVPGINIVVLIVCSGFFSAAAGILFGLPSCDQGFYLAVATLASQFFLSWCFIRIPWLYNYNISPRSRCPRARCSACRLPDRRRSPRDPLPDRAHHRRGDDVAGVEPDPRPHRPHLDGGARYGYRRRAHRHQALPDQAPGLCRVVVLLRRCRRDAGLLWLGNAESESFSINQSFLVLFMVIIGGLGSLLGSYLGAALIFGLPIVLRTLRALFDISVTSATLEHINFITLGILIIFFLIAEPAGLARLWQIGKQKLRVWPFPY